MKTLARTDWLSFRSTPGSSCGRYKHLVSSTSGGQQDLFHPAERSPAWPKEARSTPGGDRARHGGRDRCSWLLHGVKSLGHWTYLPALLLENWGNVYIYIYCSVLYSTPGVGLLLVLLAHPGLQELSAGFSPAFHVRLVKNGEGMVFRQLQACGERVGWNDRCDRTRVDPGWDRSP